MNNDIKLSYTRRKRYWPYTIDCEGHHKRHAKTFTEAVAKFCKLMNMFPPAVQVDERDMQFVRTFELCYGYPTSCYSERRFCVTYWNPAEVFRDSVKGESAEEVLSVFAHKLLEIAADQRRRRDEYYENS